MTPIRNSIKVTRELVESGEWPEWVGYLGFTGDPRKDWVRLLDLKRTGELRGRFGEHLIQWATGTIEVVDQAFMDGLVDERTAGLREAVEVGFKQINRQHVELHIGELTGPQWLAVRAALKLPIKAIQTRIKETEQ